MSELYTYKKNHIYGFRIKYFEATISSCWLSNPVFLGRNIAGNSIDTIDVDAIALFVNMVSVVMLFIMKDRQSLISTR